MIVYGILRFFRKCRQLAKARMTRAERFLYGAATVYIYPKPRIARSFFRRTPDRAVGSTILRITVPYLRIVEYEVHTDPHCK